MIRAVGADLQFYTNIIAESPPLVNSGLVRPPAR